MDKSIIILTKEHDGDFNYHYTEYENGKSIKTYSYDEMQELRKTNIIVVI